MAELGAFHKFESFEVFWVQTTYEHQSIHIHLQLPTLESSIAQHEKSQTNGDTKF